MRAQDAPAALLPYTTRAMRAKLLLVFCIVVWGWTFVATKICLAYLDPVELVGARFLIGVPLLLAVVLARRVPVRFARADAAPLAVGAGIITAHFLIQATALRYTSATHTGWMIAVIPLMIALLAQVFLKERVEQRVWTGIGIATAGIVLLVSKGRLGSLGWLENPGDWLALLSTVTWSVYTITTRDLSRSRDPLSVTLAVYTPLFLLGLGVIALRSGLAPLLALPPTGAAALAFLVVLGTIAQWFWQIGIARVGAARAGVFLYLEPIATTALAVPLLQESFGALAAAGGLLILAGVWWAERSAGRS